MVGSTLTKHLLSMEYPKIDLLCLKDPKTTFMVGVTLECSLNLKFKEYFWYILILDILNLYL